MGGNPDYGSLYPHANQCCSKNTDAAGKALTEESTTCTGEVADCKEGHNICKNRAKYFNCESAYCDGKATCVDCTNDDCGEVKKMCKCKDGYVGRGGSGECKEEKPCPEATPYAFKNGDKCCAVGKDEAGKDLTFTSD